MQIKNTFDVPVACFYLPAQGERSATILKPGASTEIELKPGDTFKMRVATEITDPVEPPAKSEEAPAEESETERKEA